MLRVSVIEPAGRLYGSEFCLLDVIDWLPRSEFSWTVFLPKDGGLDRLLLDRGIVCEFLLPKNSNETSKLLRAFAYAKILSKLWRTKPDVLYVNQAGSLRSAAIYSRALNLPIVCQVQTLEDAEWLSGEEHLHKNVKAFVCNSMFIAGKLQCDRQKKSVLYQGIPEERLQNAKDNASLRVKRGSDISRSREIALGILGRIAKSKGHYVLLEAVKLVQSKVDDIQVIVIGEGLTPKDTADFMSAVEAAELKSNFTFRGYRRDIERELVDLDLLIIPSIQEPLGRVLYDAAEHGVPVIVSDAGGLGELSQQLQIGIRFVSQDHEALAKTILRAIDEYEEVTRDFHRAARQMLESLPMDSYISRIREILLASAKRECSAEVWLGDT